VTILLITQRFLGFSGTSQTSITAFGCLVGTPVERDQLAMEPLGSSAFRAAALGVHGRLSERTSAGSDAAFTR
jgi:hypothetical protein